MNMKVVLNGKLGRAITRVVGKPGEPWLPPGPGHNGRDDAV